MEMGPGLKVSSDRLVKPGIEHATPGSIWNSQESDSPQLSRITMISSQLIIGFPERYTQKKKFSQYLCFLMKSTVLDISLSNCIHELYYRNSTCTCLLCDK